MKTNSWKYSFMALAMAAIVTGCNQNNELGTPASSGEEDVLNVVATANDFVSSDATSRIIETNYTTTFEAGDNIGVFVVRDGEALVSNMKMTLGADGTTWAGENGAKLYYYKDAGYIAYSPYTEGLSVTSEEEIITHFTTKLEGTTGQSTLADYQAADLMTASVTAAEVTRGENITFNFAHQMSMIEIKVPIRAYTTTTGDYEYSAPLGLKVKIGNQDNFSLCTFGKETTGETGSEVTKGIYRCIVAPSDAALKVEGEFQDGSAPVYFPATGGEDLSVTPEAGTYKGFDVNYTYDNYTATRDLEVGDYYYADGSIYPKKLGNAPKTGCIGIIFSTTVAEQSLIDLKCNHGYVIALNDVEGTMASAPYGKWSSNTSEVAGGADNAVYSQNATNDGMTDDNKQAVFAAKNGYDMTLTLVEKGVTAAILARDYDCAYPEGTSGWFLPAPGQVAEFLNNLSSEVQQGGADWDFAISNAFKDSDAQAQKAEMLSAIQTAFFVGDFFEDATIQSGMQNPTSDRWWTTLEVDASNAWAVELKTNGLVKFLPRGKNSKNASVRPILAF